MVDILLIQLKKFKKNKKSILKWDCIIVGAGIVGVTTAYEYLMAFPEARILLIEKEKEYFYTSKRKKQWSYSFRDLL